MRRVGSVQCTQPTSVRDGDNCYPPIGGQTFDLADLVDGETRIFGEGEKQVTVTRVGDVVSIDRAEHGESHKLELKCDVSQDSCQIITFEENEALVRKAAGDENAQLEFVRDHMTKPVVGFIAGQTAPPGRRMGHAGAIISGSAGTAAEKMAAFEENGIAVAQRPADIVGLIQDALGD